MITTSNKLSRYTIKLFKTNNSSYNYWSLYGYDTIVDWDKKNSRIYFAWSNVNIMINEWRHELGLLLPKPYNLWMGHQTIIKWVRLIKTFKLFTPPSQAQRQRGQNNFHLHTGGFESGPLYTRSQGWNRKKTFQSAPSY
jgi:hypothetical protein